MKSRLAALAGVLSGIALILAGGGVPAWLGNLLALFFCSLALLYGFTTFVPGAPAWLSSPPVLGIACVWAGVAIMWVPANVVCSAALIGFGTRCLMIEHRKQAVPSKAGPSLARRTHSEGKEMM